MNDLAAEKLTNKPANKRRDKGSKVLIVLSQNPAIDEGSDGAASENGCQHVWISMVRILHEAANFGRKAGDGGL